MMNMPFYTKKYRALCLVLMPLVIGSGLLACGKPEKTAPAMPQTAKKFGQAALLQGTVTGSGKLLDSGEVKATDLSGRVLATMFLKGGKHYQLDIPAGTGLPILLRFYPQPDSPSAQQLLAVVVELTVTQYDISPLTTAIAHKAEALGGYTRANMVMAAESMVNVPDANKTSTGFRGDPTTQYGGWH